QTTPRWTLVVVAMILACMSKPTAVGLPLILLLVDWWPLKRFSRKSLNKLFWEKLPLWMISIAMVMITLAGNTLVSGISLPLRVRIAGVLTHYFQYLGKFFWPHPLGVFYQYKVPGVEETAAALLFLTLFTVAAFSLARRFPYL